MHNPLVVLLNGFAPFLQHFHTPPVLFVFVRFVEQLVAIFAVRMTHVRFRGFPTGHRWRLDRISPTYWRLIIKETKHNTTQVGKQARKSFVYVLCLLSQSADFDVTGERRPSESRRIFSLFGRISPVCQMENA